MKRILVVDDEPHMRLGLKDNLELDGYTVETASDGEEGLTKALEGDYHLILLDVMMPKMSGLDVCKKLRAASVQTPVIFLTARGEEIDKVLGLEIGADDYITKPFGLRELLARVKAALRRSSGTASDEEEICQIGHLRIDFSAYRASDKKGKEVSLSHKEFEILKFLWEQRNKTVSRDDLLNKVWGYEETPSTRTVDNFIVRLRQKTEKDPNHPQIILTVHGIGYKLIAK